MKKSAIKTLIIIIYGILSFIIIDKIFAIPNNFLTLNRVVESLNQKNQKLYINFEDDEINYSFTEYQDITIEYVLENIHVGSFVEITIENNAGKPIYPLIQEIKVDGKVIFNSIEYYKTHNQNFKLIFIPTNIVVILAFLIIIHIDFDKKNSSERFVSKEPKYVLDIFSFCLIIGSVSPIMFSILFFTGKMDYKDYCYSYVFYIFLLFGLYGTIFFIKTKIEYNGESYIIKESLLKKTAIIPAKEIKSIVVDTTVKGKNNKSGIYDANNVKLYKLTFEFYNCSNESYFIKSLINNNVEFIELCFDEKGQVIEKKLTLKNF